MMSGRFIITVFAIITFSGIMANSSHAQRKVDLNSNREDVRILGESFNDSSGYSLAFGDIDNDGFDDLIIGSPYAGAEPGAPHGPGKVYIIYGDANFTPPRQCLPLSPIVGHKMTEIIGASVGDCLGWSVATGDIDDDNCADVIVGAPYAASDDTVGREKVKYDEGGKTYIIYSRRGTLKPISPDTINYIYLSTPPDCRVTVINAAADSIRLGWSVFSGNIDNDKYDDVIIGAPFADSIYAAPFSEKSRKDAGATYVVYGHLYLTTTPDHFYLRTPSSPIIEILGENPGNGSGWSVSSGNINMDESDDVIIGAPMADSALAHGKTYIVSGINGTHIPNPVDLKHPYDDIVIIMGVSPYDHCGWSVSSGNIDNMDFDDLIIGAPFSDESGLDAGETYIFYRDLQPPKNLIAADAQIRIKGAHTDDLSGWAVSSGDIDNDDFADIIIGAPRADASGNRPEIGQVYAIFGKSTPGKTEINAEQSDIIVSGDDYEDLAGFSVAAGNLNNNGGDDLALSAPGADSLDSGAGETYVIYQCDTIRVFAGNDTAICLGDSIILSGAAWGGTPPYGCNWSPTTGLTNPDSQTTVAKPIVTTTYTLQVTDARGCIGSDEITIMVYPELIVDAGADTTICIKDSVVLAGLAWGGTPPYIYLWTPAIGLDDPTSPTPIASPTVTTTYMFTVIDAIGIIGMDSVTVTVKVDTVAPLCRFVIDDDNNIIINLYDAETGIYEINFLEFKNGFDPPFDFTAGDQYVEFTIIPIDPTIPAIVTIEVKDFCGNTTICDPIILTARVTGPPQYEFNVSSIDKHLYVNNKGLTQINMKINNRSFEFIADPVRRDLRRNRQFMPLYGDVCVDVAPLLTEESNHVTVQVVGPTSASAHIVFSNEKLSITSSTLPQRFALYQNYPNPFNPSTKIEYTVPESFKDGAKVDLVIYNIFGQQVKKLEDDFKRPGLYSVIWDGTDRYNNLVPSGIYFYHIKVGKLSAMKRMTFMK